MPYLSAGELSQLRADALASLADGTAVVWHATSSVNSIGEAALTWAASGTAVCRIRPKGGVALAYSGDQPQTVADWVVTLPQGTAVVPGDRLVISGGTYEVTQTWDEETWRTAVRADVKRLEA